MHSESVLSTLHPLQPVKETANIDFAPDSASFGKCNKLTLHVWLDSTLFVAGGVLNGRMELNCTSASKVRLSRISVHLNGIEEINDKNYHSTQKFMSSEIIYQGEKVPPSSAVSGPAENGFWLAKKCKTIFPFSFKLPEDLPSSYSFKKIASLRYIVSGLVQVEFKKKTFGIIRKKDACVVENIPKSIYDDSKALKASTKGNPFLGRRGNVKLSALLQKSRFSSGDIIYCAVKLKNSCARRVGGLKVELIRRIIIIQPDDGEDNAKTVSETVACSKFSQREYIYHPGQERTTVLSLSIPSYLSTVQNTNLTEVLCFLRITLNMGLFSKNQFIEFPVSIYHPATFEPPNLDMSLQFAVNSTRKYKLSIPFRSKTSPVTSGMPTMKKIICSTSKKKRSNFKEAQKPYAAQKFEIGESRILPWEDNGQNYQHNEQSRGLLPIEAPISKKSNDTDCYSIPEGLSFEVPVSPIKYIKSKSKLITKQSEHLLQEHSKVFDYSIHEEKDGSNEAFWSSSIFCIYDRIANSIHAKHPALTETLLDFDDSNYNNSALKDPIPRISETFAKSKLKSSNDVKRSPQKLSETLEYTNKKKSTEYLNKSPEGPFEYMKSKVMKDMAIIPSRLSETFEYVKQKISNEYASFPPITSGSFDNTKTKVSNDYASMPPRVSGSFDYVKPRITTERLPPSPHAPDHRESSEIKRQQYQRKSTSSITTDYSITANTIEHPFILTRAIDEARSRVSESSVLKRPMGGRAGAVRRKPLPIPPTA